MKKNILMVLIPLLVATLIGCNKTDDDNNESSQDKRFNTVVPIQWQDSITLHMPFYKGTNPPNVEGVYLMKPMVAIYCSEREAGWSAVPEVFRFFNQNDKDNTVDLESYEDYKDRTVTYNIGKGAFISGKDNNFSIFFVTEGYDQAGKTTKKAMIISGTKTEDGIEKMYYGFLMLDREIESKYMNPGDVHIFMDTDELSENTEWNKVGN